MDATALHGAVQGTRARVSTQPPDLALVITCHAVHHTEQIQPLKRWKAK